MDYIEVSQEIEDMESGAAALDPARLSAIVAGIEAMQRGFAKVIGRKDAAAPSRQAVRAWEELGQRAKGLARKKEIRL